MRVLNCFKAGIAAVLVLFAFAAPAVIRDGGIDPANLGKGDWIYYMSMATNKLGGNVPWVTNEASLMMFYRSNNIRYILIKAATSDYLFNGSYSFPQFTKKLCDTAHQYGILIFGYNRSYGENVQGEVAIADYVFQQGADGFVFDAEGEWESSQPWILDQGPAKAWDLCSQVRSNWPTKFLAHAPFPIISYHASFPYKEFGFWCDAVMPQIYPQNWTGVKSRPSGGINWTDANFAKWQDSLYSLPPTNINGIQIWWTNAIKPLAPVNHVYGPNPPNSGVAHIDDDFVTEFVDYLCADTHAVTIGGYQGANFWRTDLHGSAQWTNIGRTTIGSFPGVINNIVLDDPSGTVSGAWQPVRTFSNGKLYGDGSGTDTNSFGTNYLIIPKGAGDAHVEFRPNVLTPGDYNVYEWHPSLAAASASVPHVIQHASGTTTVYANQKTNAGRWSFLGRFAFNAGTAGSVRGWNSITEADGVAIADGIKWVFAPPTSPPQPPTGLSAVEAGVSGINLTWVDASTNEASFSIYRASTPGGPYAEVGSTGANQTAWADTNLQDGTTYYYVVRAANMVGSSADSNEAFATTLPAVPEPPVIVSPPKSIGVPEGAPAVLRVTADGTRPFSYQWRFEGAPMAGQTSSMLTIPAVQPANVGNYSVTITNRYGMASSDPIRVGIVSIGISGDNSLGQRDAPASATGLVNIAAGSWHFLGLREDGTVCAWGANYDGQCDPPQDPGYVLAIAAGGYHSLAILDDLSVRAWGANQSGQCAVPADLGKAIAIAGGQWHSVAARVDGTVRAWGDNSWGQAQAPAALKNVVSVAAGAIHTLALRSDGTVAAWGGNDDGQGYWSGQAVAPQNLRARAIAAGDYHNLALLTNGSVVAWGANNHWQCAVPATVTNAVAIAAGAAHSIALLRNGLVIAWGANESGQCSIWQSARAPVAITAGGVCSGVLWEDGALPPRLWVQSISMRNFAAAAQTRCGQKYELQWTVSLASGLWNNLGPVEGNGALMMFRHAHAPQATGFYKLVTR